MRKKFFTRMFVFVVILFVADRLIGILFATLYDNSNDKTISKLRYTIDSTEQEVIILGSSRAQHHFNPLIINEETGLSAYNCGFGGQGLAFSYIQLNEITKRYLPKLLILEISPEILIDHESNDKLKIFLPFIKRDSLIKNILIREEPLEELKLLSHIYPYNSTFIKLVKAFSKKKEDTYNGFYPLERQIDTTQKVILSDFSSVNCNIPDSKFDYLSKIVKLCGSKNVPLLIIISPYYQVNEDLIKMNKQIESYCHNYNWIYFENYSKYEGTQHQFQLFQDNAHLNLAGANLFSREVSKVINQISLDPESNMNPKYTLIIE